MSLSRNWPLSRMGLQLLGMSVFLAGFLFFLISACAKKQPTAQRPNQPPQLLLVPASPAPSVNENQTVNFGLTASDPEGALPVLTAPGLPKNAAFTDSANGRGSFSWTPTFSQEGNYLLHFIASDGLLADTERVMISVGNVNRPPFLLPVDSQFFVEGVARAFGVRGIDPDGDSIFLSADSLPNGAFLVDSLNGRGALFWTPDFNQLGEYSPILTVTDREFTGSERPTLVVVDFDRAPEMDSLPGQRVTEGQILSFSISAADPDGDGLALSAVRLPPGAVFVDSGNGKGGFFWQTKVLQANTFFDTSVTFVAASRALADTLPVRIKVDTALLTYTNHTKVVFDDNCQPCHFPGGIRCPPSCWNTYSGVFQARTNIRIRVINGTMPPVPGGLPQGQRDTINAWVLRGALQ